jgi:hypothetical protein
MSKQHNEDLERMRSFGAYEERERITKLIQNQTVAVCPCQDCSLRRDLIELINEEQK